MEKLNLTPNETNNQAPTGWEELSNLEMPPGGRVNYQRYVKQLGGFSPEQMREYDEDRAEENLRMLEVTDNPALAKLYKRVLAVAPKLSKVKLVNEDLDGNASFHGDAKDTVTGQALPIISFNFSHPEKCRLSLADSLNPRQEKQDKRRGLTLATKQLALQMGADWRDCIRNEKLSSEVMLLHELGHAHNFFKNYLNPAREANKSFYDPLTNAAVSLETATKALERDRPRPMTELTTADQAAYRETPDETYADAFAMDYISCYYDEYFVMRSTLPEDKSAQKQEKRIRMEFGQEIPIPMDADFTYILGLTKGSEVTIEPVLEPEKAPSSYDMTDGDYGIYHYESAKRFNEDGVYLSRHGIPKNRVGRHEKPSITGTLSKTVKENHAICFNGENGPTTICKNAHWFRYVPIKDPETGKVKTEIYFSDKNNLKYRINRDKKAPNARG